jgi:arginase
MNQFILSPFSLDQRATVMDRLATPEWIVNMPALDGDGTTARMGAVHRPLAELVERAVIGGRRPVSIGGDCCQTLPVMAGLRRAGVDPILVWLDAHGDFNTWDTSPSGFIGGMPLAMHVGRGDLTLLEQLALAPMSETDVVLSDARDLDPQERISLAGSGVAHVGRIEDLLTRIPDTRPIYVHFDVDIIDAREAPAMSYPVTGGPTVATLTDVARRIRASDRLAAVSVTVWALDRDQDRQTERACMGVLDALVADR